MLVVTLILFLFVQCTLGNTQFGFTNDTIGAAYDYYVVNKTDVTATLTCTNFGSRCVFQREDYTSYDFGTGQETDTAQGATWAALDPTTDKLTLTGCVATTGSSSSSSSSGSNSSTTATTKSGSSDENICLVICNANCTCDYSGETCDKLDGPPNYNDITATDAPVPDKYTECPKQKYTEFCNDLMNLPAPALPAGTVGNYDCYNFCGGIFISSCDLSTGNCGVTTCDNATADGTITGQIQGCTDANRPASNETGTSGGAPVPSSSSFYSSIPSLVLLFGIAMIV